MYPCTNQKVKKKGQLQLYVLLEMDLHSNLYPVEREREREREREQCIIM